MSANFDSNVSLTLQVAFNSEPFDETQSYTEHLQLGVVELMS